MWCLFKINGKASFDLAMNLVHELVTPLKCLYIGLRDFWYSNCLRRCLFIAICHNIDSFINLTLLQYAHLKQLFKEWFFFILADPFIHENLPFLSWIAVLIGLLHYLIVINFELCKKISQIFLHRYRCYKKYYYHKNQYGL